MTQLIKQAPIATASKPWKTKDTIEDNPVRLPKGASSAAKPGIPNENYHFEQRTHIMNHDETLRNLQTALAMELTAAHQYQLHASILADWGMDRLATQMRQEMQEELGHSDEYIARIMFLKGQPSMALAKTPVLVESLVEMFEADLADESEAIAFYSSAAQQAAGNGDIGTRTLFERIVMDEEGHMAWLELQLSLIKRIGEPIYISTHMTAPGEAEQS